MAERQLPKLHTRVRFPSPAPKALGRESAAVRQWAVLEIFKNQKKKRPAGRPFPSSAVRPMAMVQHAGRLHGSVAVPPVIAPIAIGVGIAGAEVLTIGVRVKLRAIAGVFDHLLRQRGRRESCRSNRSGANQCEFHPFLLSRVTNSSYNEEMVTRLAFRQLRFG
jgi:hypothetical protein